MASAGACGVTRARAAQGEGGLTRTRVVCVRCPLGDRADHEIAAAALSCVGNVLQVCVATRCCCANGGVPAAMTPRAPADARARARRRRGAGRGGARGRPPRRTAAVRCRRRARLRVSISGSLGRARFHIGIASRRVLSDVGAAAHHADALTALSRAAEHYSDALAGVRRSRARARDASNAFTFVCVCAARPRRSRGRASRARL